MAFGRRRGGAALRVVGVLFGAPWRVASRYEVFALLLRVKAGAAAPARGGLCCSALVVRAAGHDCLAADGLVLEHRGIMAQFGFVWRWWRAATRAHLLRLHGSASTTWV